MRRILIVLVLAGVFIAPGITARAGGGFCHEPSQTERTGTTIEYKDFCPTPTTLHVKVGDIVTWTNIDPFDHTVTSGFGTWADKTLGPHQQFSYRFDDAGSYTYYCMLHPGMGGTVVVGDTSNAAPVAATKATPPSSNAGAVALASMLGLVVGITGMGLLGRRSRANGSGGQQA